MSKPNYWAVAGVLWVALLFFQGFVAWQLWQWHAVPIGAPVLSYAHATGLGLIVQHVIPYHSPLHKTPEADNKKLVTRMLKPLVILFVGWVLSS